MLFLPPLTRFELNNNNYTYQRRIIDNDKVYRVSIPLSRWNKNTSYHVNKWIKQNNIECTFPYGNIQHETGTNTMDVILNACEYCGRKMKNLKNKRNHMINCKHMPYEDKDEEYKITHELESNITEEIVDEPTTSPGIVYLIQPGNLLGTNRYKVGCSKSPTFNRCLSYGLGSKVILILKVNEPYKVETFILRELRKKYKPYYGNEWFAGNEDVIYNDVFEAYTEYRKLI